MAFNLNKNARQLSKGDRLASGSIFTFASIIAQRIATIVNAIVIIRILGPSDYGVISIIVLTISLGTTFATFQIPLALVKFLAAISPENPSEANRLLGAGFIMVVITTCITVAILVILAPILALSLYGDPRIKFLLLVGIVGLTMSSLSSPFISILQGFEKIKEIGLRVTLAALLSIPTTFALVFLFTLQGAILAMVVNASISIIINISILRKLWKVRQLRLEIPRRRLEYRKIIIYVIPALASAVILSWVLWFCSTLLATSGSFVELGQYTAGYGLANYLMFIPAAIGVPFIPMVSKIYKEKSNEFSSFMLRTIRVTASLTLLVALIMVALPEPFLRILYGSSYVGAANVVRLVAPAFFLASIGSIVGYGMAGTGQMFGALLLNGLWAFPMIAMSITVVPTWGSNGLALTVFVAYVVLFIAALTFARFVWSVNVKNFMIILIIATASLPTIAFISLFTGSWRFWFSLCVIGATAYALYRNLNPRELEVLIGPIGKLLIKIRRL